MSKTWVSMAPVLCLSMALVAPVCGSAVPQSEMDEARAEMVERQIEARGLEDPCVLQAMRSVPRHLFLPEAARGEAHLDRPVRIAEGQTMSQPYIVALMTELLELDEDDRVLEIGTGSGYHAAVMSRCAAKVYTIEILEPLGRTARETLERLGYDNVEVRIGDGYRGWPEQAPFDAVILTAAPPKIPQPLIDQLAVGGRLVAPVGDFFQDLQLLRKTEDGIEIESVAPVRFVPMTGEARDEGR
jgi:protein-L-isoaspartate(D-aspartate) O-methyltransferase